VNWHENTLVSFDLETTGVDVETARIVTASIVTIDPLAGSIDQAEWLADPGVEIPAEATAVHGITTEMAREAGRPAAEVCKEIASTLFAAWHAMHPVIVYNASYDLSLLDRECRRYHGDGVWHGSVVDPLVLDKHYDRYRRGSRKLIDTTRHYGIVLSDQDAHGSSADALAAARVAWCLAKRYPELAGMRLPELHAHQEEWHAEQAAGLQQYFDRKGIREHVATEWPVRPVPSRKAVA
jgi:DNA polymerase-3 subunit epsilon